MTWALVASIARNYGSEIEVEVEVEDPYLVTHTFVRVEDRSGQTGIFLPKVRKEEINVCNISQ